MSIDVYPNPVDVILGSMAYQNASAVAITGGTAILSNLSTDSPTLVIDAINHRVGIKNAAPSYPLDITGAVRIMGSLGIGIVSAGHPLQILYNPTSFYGIQIQPNAESGSRFAIIFTNAIATPVGSIATTSTATAYNTSSDVRLKHNIEKLVGALNKIQLLNPISFLWNADNSPGEGFAAHELQQVVPLAITGEKDAVNEDGSIRPQQADYSKIVPWLVGALQELANKFLSLEMEVAKLKAELDSV